MSEAPEWTYEVHELSEGFSAIVYDEHGRMVADHLSEDRAALIAAAHDMRAALDKCRVIIKFHTKPERCCSFTSGGKPFSALDAYTEAVSALAKSTPILTDQVADSFEGEGDRG